MADTFDIQNSKANQLYIISKFVCTLNKEQTKLFEEIIGILRKGQRETEENVVILTQQLKKANEKLERLNNPPQKRKGKKDDK